MVKILIFLMTLVSFIIMPVIGIENANIANNAKILCENSSLGNTTEIILDGEGIHITRLIDLRIATGRVSIYVDYQKHEFTFADIDKENNLIREGSTTTRPDGNESSFKVSGKNLKIVKPCDKNAPFGGIVCKINFTSRNTSISSAW
jgi:hypothetical protein